MVLWWCCAWHCGTSRAARAPRPRPRRLCMPRARLGEKGAHWQYGDNHSQTSKAILDFLHGPERSLVVHCRTVAIAEGWVLCVNHPCSGRGTTQPSWLYLMLKYQDYHMLDVLLENLIRQAL